MKKPNLFEYLDVVLFLKDIYRFRKLTEKDFSYEKWSQELGLKSRSYLRLLVMSKRPFSTSLLPQFAKQMQLSSDETEYMNLLVHYAQAPSVEMRESYGRQLILKWKHTLNQSVVEDAETYLADALTPIAFTYISDLKGQATLASLCQHLNIAAERAHSIIKNLARLELIETHTSKDHAFRYLALNQFAKIPDDPYNPLIKKFHFEGMQQAIEAHDLPSELRNYRSVICSLSSEQVMILRGLINEFIKSTLATSEVEPTQTKKRIYRMNLQLFPVSTEIDFKSDKEIETHPA